MLGEGHLHLRFAAGAKVQVRSLFSSILRPFVAHLQDIPLHNELDGKVTFSSILCDSRESFEHAS